MKKKKALWMILFACFALCIFTPHNAFAKEYDPHATVVLNPPFKNLDTFKESELPELIIEWAKRWKTSENTPPREVMRKYFDSANYIGQNYAYNLYGLFDDGIRFTVKVPARNNYEFVVLLAEYQYKDGKIRQRQQRAEKEISPEEFNKIKLLWANLFCESAEYHSRKFTKEIPLREKIIERHEEQLIKYELLEKRGMLEKILAGKTVKIDGIDYPMEELMFIPAKSGSDLDFASFAPKLAIVTPSKYIYGLCFLESGVIMVHPAGTVISWLLGIGDVGTHEQFHRNRYLQGYLWNGEFDVESWAELSERLKHGWFDYLFGHYLRSLRQAGKIITSLDAERAKKEMFLVKTGAIGSHDINEILFDEYAGKAEKNYRDLKRGLFEKFLPSFYQDPLFWNPVNQRLKDDNAAVKIFLYSQYAFSLLNGPQETKKWLEENEQTLIEAYNKTLKRIKKDSTPDQEEYSIGATPPFDEAALIEVAQLLNLRASSKKELIEQIRALIKGGIISCPQIRFDPSSTKEFGYVKSKK